MRDALLILAAAAIGNGTAAAVYVRWTRSPGPLAWDEGTGGAA